MLLALRYRFRSGLRVRSNPLFDRGMGSIAETNPMNEGREKRTRRRGFFANRIGAAGTSRAFPDARLVVIDDQVSICDGKLNRFPGETAAFLVATAAPAERESYLNIRWAGRALPCAPRGKRLGNPGVPLADFNPPGKPTQSRNEANGDHSGKTNPAPTCFAKRTQGSNLPKGTRPSTSASRPGTCFRLLIFIRDGWRLTHFPGEGRGIVASCRWSRSPRKMR